MAPRNTAQGSSIGLPGETYGRLTILAEAASLIRASGGATRFVRCLCSCGAEVETRLSGLRNGHTQSCGCKAQEKKIKAGDRFGWLTVEKRVGRRAICVCDCGEISDVEAGNLRNGSTTSCGCRTRPHGHAAGPRTPTYIAWMGMRDRCGNPNNRHYKHYGGRGISVCPRWQESFSAFLADMGERPSPALSLDRINNDGNYEPGNCRWATAVEQRANRRDSVR